MKNRQDILLCDLDAFFASVEQLENPHLLGKPVIVGGSPEGRGVVSTCSYEARQYGVRSAMPVKKALALCPNAVLVRGRMKKYVEYSRKVINFYRNFTPSIEEVSIDEAYLALPPCSGRKTAEEIHKAIKDELGLPVSVGVSNNKLLAKIACELAKPNSVGTLWIKDIEEKLWPLPIKYLPGVGPKTGNILNNLGIFTIGELAIFPDKLLRKTLGNQTELIRGYAHGIDSREVAPAQKAKSISEETTFKTDIRDKEKVKAILTGLAADVGYRLRSGGFYCRTIALKLRFSDFSTITRSVSLEEGINRDMDIYRHAERLFESNCGRPPWRLIGIHASGLSEEIQLSWLSPSDDDRREEKLTSTRDNLYRKYGKDVLFRARRLQETDD